MTDHPDNASFLLNRDLTEEESKSKTTRLGLTSRSAEVAGRTKRASTAPQSTDTMKKRSLGFRLLRAFKSQDIGRNMREIVCEWSWFVNSIQLQPTSLDVVYALNIILLYPYTAEYCGIFLDAANLDKVAHEMMMQ